MCGILGHINLTGPLTAVPETNKIKHRGPDGEGKWTNSLSNVFIGHTRLAILELSEAGEQPMQDASGRYIITFNGEIYNHLALRQLLPKVSWRGTSDTETLVELYAMKGVEALPLLKGMFAFAVYDKEDGSLLLARDRLGIKPLWIKHDVDSFSFASEVRALLPEDCVNFTSEALGEYIAFGRMPGSGEIIKGIYGMPAGTWFRISANGGTTTGQWWPLKQFKAKSKVSRIESAQHVKKLVTTAVEEHLICDVEVGAFLSGGIDSSIVTLVAGKALGRKLHTFSVGFPQATHDERSIARKVAGLAGTEHNELEVIEDTCLNWVLEAVSKLDLPSVDAINTYIVSKAVSETGIKVALSGLGGDELFGGYPSFKDIPMLNYLQLVPDHLKERFISWMPNQFKDKFEGIEQFGITDLTVNRRRFTSVERLRKLGLLPGEPMIPAAPSGLDTMGNISWAEIQGYMIPMLLRDSDQMSMAVGLEIRVPFLDHCLVEEVLTIHQEIKKGKGVKPLLVEAFKAELPAEVYNRPKQGFALPMDAWMRGPLADFVNTGIDAAVDILGVVEPYNQFDAFLDGKIHWTRVWHWCVLGHWLSSQGAYRKVSVPADLTI